MLPPQYHYKVECETCHKQYKKNVFMKGVISSEESLKVLKEEGRQDVDG